MPSPLSGLFGLFVNAPWPVWELLHLLSPDSLQSCFNWSTRSLSGEHAVPTRGLVSTLGQIVTHLSLFPANAHAWLPDIKTLVLNPTVDAIMAIYQ
jgi:hypothetical protein